MGSDKKPSNGAHPLTSNKRASKKSKSAGSREQKAASKDSKGASKDKTGSKKGVRMQPADVEPGPAGEVSKTSGIYDSLD
jgi:hypothetical protein